VPKPPSPCLDVCKFRLDGHCIACGMTKKQKKGFKRLDGGKARRKFLTALVAQQARLAERFSGKLKGWARAYRRKCEKKGVESPIG
jgi:predicted Fe-S protein YdhL (DUF1289 family)